MDEHYWGLTGRPFQLTPDPRFWFETATHRKAMAYLGYGLAQGEGFIVITGDIGAGKTTLVGHLLDTIDRQRIEPIRIASSAIEPEDLLRIVAGQLGVDPAGLSKAQLLVAIERGLHAVARSGRRSLLVVDEAQALPVAALEELRMLSNVQAGGHALLQIVLLGQPEFRERLHGSERLEQLRQRVIAIHHLDPMEEGEVADYLAHRLQVVGWRGRPDFAADAFEAFYRGSAGVPRRLNMLAARVMLHASIEQLDLIDGRVVRQVVRDLHADLPQIAVAPMPIVAPSAPPRAEAPLPIAAPSAPLEVAAPVDPLVSSEVDAESAPAPLVPSEAEGRVSGVIPEPRVSTSLDTNGEGASHPTLAKPHPRWFASVPEAVSPTLEQPAPGAPRPARGWFGSTATPVAVPTFTEWKAARTSAPEEADVPVESIEPASDPLRHHGRVPGSTEPQEPQRVARADEWMPEQVRHDEEEDVLDAQAGSAADHDPAPAPEPDADLAERLARLEGRVDEQDAALLRVLTLLVDWVEGDDRAAAPAPAPAPKPAPTPTPIRGAMPWTDAA